LLGLVVLVLVLLLVLLMLVLLLLGGLLLRWGLLRRGLRMRRGVTVVGARKEGDDIRWRVVSLVAIYSAAAGGPQGLDWRRGIESAVEVLRRGSGTINEVCEGKMRGVSRAASSRCYLRLLLGGLRGRLLRGRLCRLGRLAEKALL
jgi:hypothetical protein